MADIVTSGPPTSYGSDSTTEDTTAHTVKDNAKAVGHSAAQAASGVATSVKDQGGEVVAETGRQTRDLLGQVRTQVSDQAGAQQKRAADALRALGDEVGSMAEQGGQSGPASTVARHASTKINGAAQWLGDREPSDVLDEVKRYARNHPGTFLLGAAVLGVLAGRLVKNMVPESNDTPAADSSHWSTASRRQPVSPTTASYDTQVSDDLLAEPAGDGPYIGGLRP